MAGKKKYTKPTIVFHGKNSEVHKKLLCAENSSKISRDKTTTRV